MGEVVAFSVAVGVLGLAFNFGLKSGFWVEGGVEGVGGEFVKVFGCGVFEVDVLVVGAGEFLGEAVKEGGGRVGFGTFSGVAALVGRDGGEGGVLLVVS